MSLIFRKNAASEGTADENLIHFGGTSTFPSESKPQDGLTDQNRKRRWRSVALAMTLLVIFIVLVVLIDIYHAASHASIGPGSTVAIDLSQTAPVAKEATVVITMQGVVSFQSYLGTRVYLERMTCATSIKPNEAKEKQNLFSLNFELHQQWEKSGFGFSANSSFSDINYEIFRNASLGDNLSGILSVSCKVTAKFTTLGVGYVGWSFPASFATPFDLMELKHRTEAASAISAKSREDFARSSPVYSSATSTLLITEYSLPVPKSLKKSLNNLNLAHLNVKVPKLEYALSFGSSVAQTCPLLASIYLDRNRDGTVNLVQDSSIIVTFSLSAESKDTSDSCSIVKALIEPLLSDADALFSVHLANPSPAVDVISSFLGPKHFLAKTANDAQLASAFQLTPSTIVSTSSTVMSENKDVKLSDIDVPVSYVCDVYNIDGLFQTNICDEVISVVQISDAAVAALGSLSLGVNEIDGELSLHFKLLTIKTSLTIGYDSLPYYGIMSADVTAFGYHLLDLHGGLNLTKDDSGGSHEPYALSARLTDIAIINAESSLRGTIYISDVSNWSYQVESTTDFAGSSINNATVDGAVRIDLPLSSGNISMSFSSVTETLGKLSFGVFNAFDLQSIDKASLNVSASLMLGSSEYNIMEIFAMKFNPETNKHDITFDVTIPDMNGLNMTLNPLYLNAPFQPVVLPIGSSKPIFDSQSGYVYFTHGTCLRCTTSLTGPTLWEECLPSNVSGLSRPTLDDGIVYTLTGEGEVVARDAGSGNITWAYRPYYSEIIRPIDFNTDAPVVYHGLVYIVGLDSILYALSHIPKSDLPWLQWSQTCTTRASCSSECGYNRMNCNGCCWGCNFKVGSDCSSLLDGQSSTDLCHWSCTDHTNTDHTDTTSSEIWRVPPPAVYTLLSFPTLVTASNVWTGWGYKDVSILLSLTTSCELMVLDSLTGILVTNLPAPEGMMNCSAHQNLNFIVDPRSFNYYYGYWRGFISFESENRAIFVSRFELHFSYFGSIVLSGVSYSLPMTFSFQRNFKFYYSEFSFAVYAVSPTEVYIIDLVRGITGLVPSADIDSVIPLDGYKAVLVLADGSIKAVSTELTFSSSLAIESCEPFTVTNTSYPVICTRQICRRNTEPLSRSKVHFSTTGCIGDTFLTVGTHDSQQYFDDKHNDVCATGHIELPSSPDTVFTYDESSCVNVTISQNCFKGTECSGQTALSLRSLTFRFNQAQHLSHPSANGANVLWAGEHEIYFLSQSTGALTVIETYGYLPDTRKDILKIATTSELEYMFDGVPLSIIHETTSVEMSSDWIFGGFSQINMQSLSLVVHENDFEVKVFLDGNKSTSMAIELDGHFGVKPFYFSGELSSKNLPQPINIDSSMNINYADGPEGLTVGFDLAAPADTAILMGLSYNISDFNMFLKSNVLTVVFNAMVAFSNKKNKFNLESSVGLGIAPDDLGLSNQDWNLALSSESPWPTYRFNSMKSGVSPFVANINDKSTVNWKLSLGSPIISQPIIDKLGNIYVTTEDNCLHSISPFKSTSATTVVESWNICPPFLKSPSNPSILNGNIVAFFSIDGTLYLVDTAGKIVEKNNLIIKAGLSSSLTLSHLVAPLFSTIGSNFGNVVFLPLSDGTFCLFDYESMRCFNNQGLPTFGIKGANVTSVAMSTSHLFVGFTNGEVLCFSTGFAFKTLDLKYKVPNFANDIAMNFNENAPTEIPYWWWSWYLNPFFNRIDILGTSSAKSSQAMVSTTYQCQSKSSNLLQLFYWKTQTECELSSHYSSSLLEFDLDTTDFLTNLGESQFLVNHGKSIMLPFEVAYTSESTLTPVTVDKNKIAVFGNSAGNLSFGSFYVDAKKVSLFEYFDGYKSINSWGCNGCEYTVCPYNSFGLESIHVQGLVYITVLNSTGNIIDGFTLPSSGVWSPNVQVCSQVKFEVTCTPTVFGSSDGCSFSYGRFDDIWGQNSFSINRYYGINQRNEYINRDQWYWQRTQPFPPTVHVCPGDSMDLTIQNLQCYGDGGITFDLFKDFDASTLVPSGRLGFVTTAAPHTILSFDDQCVDAYVLFEHVNSGSCHAHGSGSIAITHLVKTPTKSIPVGLSAISFQPSIGADGTVYVVSQDTLISVGGEPIELCPTGQGLLTGLSGEYKCVPCINNLISNNFCTAGIDKNSAYLVSIHAKASGSYENSNDNEWRTVIDSATLELPPFDLTLIKVKRGSIHNTPFGLKVNMSSIETALNTHSSFMFETKPQEVLFVTQNKIPLVSSDILGALYFNSEKQILAGKVDLKNPNIFTVYASLKYSDLLKLKFPPALIVGEVSLGNYSFGDLDNSIRDGFDLIASYNHFYWYEEPSFVSTLCRRGFVRSFQNATHCSPCPYGKSTVHDGSSECVSMQSIVLASEKRCPGYSSMKKILPQGSVSVKYMPSSEEKMLVFTGVNKAFFDAVSTVEARFVFSHHKVNVGGQSFPGVLSKRDDSVEQRVYLAVPPYSGKTFFHLSFPSCVEHLLKPGQYISKLRLKFYNVRPEDMLTADRVVGCKDYHLDHESAFDVSSGVCTVNPQLF